MEVDLLLHILTGEATNEEKKEFYSRLNGNKEEEEIFYQVKSLWIKSSLSKTTSDEDAEFEILWERIKNQAVKAALSNEDRNAGLSNQARKAALPNEAGKAALPMWARVLSYAAVFLLIMNLGASLGYMIFMNPIRNAGQEVQKYATMKGSTGRVELADGTRIWLNSDSEFTYREGRKKQQRIGTLKGEAYFEVAHNEDSPFIVEAGNIIIRDMGTTFNIKAYAGDEYIEASLEEGKADILTTKGEKLLSLSPGEKAIYYTQQDKIELRPATGDILSGWREGKFIIRDRRLEDIFNELNRWYDVKFIFENKEIGDHRFTGSIKNSATVRQILEMLKLTTDFNYRIIENDTTSDLVVIY